MGGRGSTCWGDHEKRLAVEDCLAVAVGDVTNRMWPVRGQSVLATYQWYEGADVQRWIAPHRIDDGYDLRYIWLRTADSVTPKVAHHDTHPRT